jgi:hypothetical protein
MLIVKQGFSKTEKRVVENILFNSIDLYGDFYLTRDNIRLFLRDNPDILFECLKKGDRYAYDDSSEFGMAFITGWSDRSPRKYVKLLTKDEKLASNLLKIINWNIKGDLYAKLKKNNPMTKVFLRNSYSFAGDRGTEILLMHKYIARPERIMKKEEDE